MADSERKTLELLEQLVRWTRLMVYSIPRPAILQALATEQARRAYHYSDGRTSREVAKLAGIKSKDRVIGYWKKWWELGIAEPIPAKGGGERFKRIFKLSEFALQEPEKRTKATKTPKTEPCKPGAVEARSSDTEEPSVPETDQ